MLNDARWRRLNTFCITFLMAVCSEKFSRTQPAFSPHSVCEIIYIFISLDVFTAVKLFEISFQSKFNKKLIALLVKVCSWIMKISFIFYNEYIYWKSMSNFILNYTIPLHLISICRQYIRLRIIACVFLFVYVFGYFILQSISL